MPRIVEDESQYESWKNATRGKVVLKRVDRNGQLIDEIVAGGKTFHITPNERRLNQEMAANDRLDMFQNGLLSPVRLIETSEDAAAIGSNPNLMSESDMENLFKTRTLKAFSEKVGTVTNPVVIRRMLEIAQDVDASLKQVEALNARLVDLSPDMVAEVQVLESSEGRTGIGTKAPSSP